MFKINLLLILSNFGIILEVVSKKNFWKKGFFLKKKNKFKDSKRFFNKIGTFFFIPYKDIFVSSNVAIICESFLLITFPSRIKNLMLVEIYIYNAYNTFYIYIV